MPALFKPIDAPPRARVSDVVAAEIKRHIVAGSLKPGDSLPAERELARQLEVSRPALREALLKLETRDVIAVRRNAGYTVAEATAPSLTDPLLRLMEDHPKAVADVLELRQGLETLTATLAALRAEEGDVAAMVQAVEETDRNQAAGDAAAAAEWDARFHLAVADATHNVALMHVMRGLFAVMRDNVRRARESLFRRADAEQTLCEQHHALVAAIRAHDAEAAVRAAESHLNFIRTGIHGIED